LLLIDFDLTVSPPHKSAGLKYAGKSKKFLLCVLRGVSEALHKQRNASTGGKTFFRAFTLFAIISISYPQSLPAIFLEGKAGTTFKADGLMR
jgi:hypothetical protein